ncbi:hypothetical protein [Streptomyces sp. enrichment culture]|uniref:hypothetical protein n=1 Tax=Streptomyces sp. enrichment culture TaxID=1795815 RepID=UPI003F545315
MRNTTARTLRSTVRTLAASAGVTLALTVGATTLTSVLPVDAVKGDSAWGNGHKPAAPRH